LLYTGANQQDEFILSTSLLFAGAHYPCKQLFLSVCSNYSFLIIGSSSILNSHFADVTQSYSFLKLQICCYFSVW